MLFEVLAWSFIGAVAAIAFVISATIIIAFLQDFRSRGELIAFMITVVISAGFVWALFYLGTV